MILFISSILILACGKVCLTKNFGVCGKKARILGIITFIISIPFIIFEFNNELLLKIENTIFFHLLKFEIPILILILIIGVLISGNDFKKPPKQINFDLLDKLSARIIIWMQLIFFIFFTTKIISTLFYSNFNKMYLHIIGITIYLFLHIFGIISMMNKKKYGYYINFWLTGYWWLVLILFNIVDFILPKYSIFKIDNNIFQIIFFCVSTFVIILCVKLYCQNNTAINKVVKIFLLIILVLYSCKIVLNYNQIFSDDERLEYYVKIDSAIKKYKTDTGKLPVDINLLIPDYLKSIEEKIYYSKINNDSYMLILNMNQLSKNNWSETPVFGQAITGVKLKN